MATRLIPKSAAASRVQRLRVRILQKARISVSCESCVLSGRCFCVGLITRPGRITECDREASTIRRPWPTGGFRAKVGEGGGVLGISSSQ